MNDGYTKIKNELITSSKLDDLEYRILSYMLSIQKNGSCFPSIRRIAELFSTEDGKSRSTTTIIKKVKKLESKGFITKKNRILGTGKKTSNIYLINEDAISKNKKKSRPQHELSVSQNEMEISEYDWLGDKN